MKKKLFLSLVFYSIPVHADIIFSEEKRSSSEDFSFPYPYSSFRNQEISHAFQTLLHCILFSLDTNVKFGIAGRQEHAFQKLLSLEERQAQLWFRKLLRPTEEKVSTAAKLYGLYGLLLLGIPKADWDHLAQPLWKENPWAFIQSNSSHFLFSTRKLIEFWKEK